MERSKKVLSLKERRLFSRAYRKGKCISGHCLVLYDLPSHKIDITRLGVTVSKDRGKAVVRNKTKRKIKEAYRSLYPQIKVGRIIVIVARQACVDAHFTVIKSELQDLLTKANLLDTHE